MRLYEDLAWMWSAVTPPNTYAEEAETLMDILEDVLGERPRRILELGSGGGYLLHDLQVQYPDVEITLVDSSQAMLHEAKLRNPRAHLVEGDMTKLDLGTQFDVVFLHDAVMYLESAEALRQTLAVMKAHLSPNGVAIIVPDSCTETFEDRILTAEVRTNTVDLHLTEWHWDPDPADAYIQVEFSLLLRQREGEGIQSVHESHRMLLLSISEWMELFLSQGWMQTFSSVPWMHGGEFFILQPL